MAGTVRRFGRYVTGPETDRAALSANEMLGYVADTAPTSTIVYRLGGWVGRNGGSNAAVRFALHETAGLEPGNVVASTAAATASAAYTDISGGAAVVANLAAPVVVNGGNYAISVATTQPLSSSMRAAAAISGQNEKFYRRSAPSGAPQSLSGVTGTNEGHMSLWAEGEPSVRPNKPTALTPAGTISGAGLAPVLTSSFSDPNEVLNNGAEFDYLNRYQIRMIRVSDGATMWAPSAFVASTTERNNGATSRTYAGSTLSYNTAYRYEIRHEDRTGLWSDWASVTFTLASLSSVERPTSPAGFITNRANPGNITAVYRHGAMLNANAMQARLLSSAGAIITTSAVFPVSLAPNGTLALTWAGSGFGAYVQDGGSYQVQVRARDTNNVWSPAWSPAQSFRFNAAPGTPVHLWPDDNRVSSDRPRIICDAIDPDPEHPHPLPTVYAEIMDDTGTVLQTRTMSYNAAQDFYYYQTTSADLPAHDDYRWTAYSFDGFLYSGGATTAAAAARAPIASFVYAIAPSVTITGPASPIATTTPVIEWTSTDQTHYRIRLYHPDTDALVYDSGTVASSAQSAPIASGNWLGGEKWNSGETFNAVVSVTDSTTLTGDSAPFPILLEYTPPASLAVTAYAHALSGTPGTNAVRLEIEPSSYSAEELERIVVERVELLADGVTDRAGTRIPLLEITDPSITIVLDAEVTSRQWYRYDVYQEITQGNDTLRSAVTNALAMVTWSGVILHCPVDPEALHVALEYGPEGGDWEPSMDYDQPTRIVNPAGQGGRVVFFGRGQTHDPSSTFGLITDRYSTADQKRAALDLVYEAQGGEWDGRPHAVCWRDGRGGRQGRIYGVISQPRVTNKRIGMSYEVDLSIVESTVEIGTGA